VRKDAPPWSVLSFFKEDPMKQVLRDSGVEYTMTTEKIYPGDTDFNPKYTAYVAIHGYHHGRAHYEYEGIPLEEEEYA
jgi:hypothetical protein